MDGRLVSVVIPTYKRGPDMVLRAIRSVLTQTYSNLEVVVVDDSPDDYEARKDVEDLIKSIRDPRVRYIKHRTNMGACAARNTGIEACRGEFLAFLDDDDEWLPKKLEKQMDVMADSQVGIVYCRCFVVDDVRNRQWIDRRRCHAGWVFDKLLVENFIGSTSFVLIRRVCIDECGMFDVTMSSSQDVELWLRIAKRYAVGFVDEPLVKYHVHPQPRISTDCHKVIEGIQRLNQYYQDYLDMNPRIKSIRKLRTVPYLLAIGQTKKGLSTYWEAVRTYPLNIWFHLRYAGHLLRHFFYLGKSRHP